MTSKTKKSARSKPVTIANFNLTKVGIQDMFKIWKVQVRPGVRNPVDCLLALCCLQFDGTRGTVAEFEDHINTIVGQLQLARENIPEKLIAKCVLKGLEGEYFDNVVFHNVAYYGFSLEKLFGVLKTHESKLLKKKNMETKKEHVMGENKDSGFQEEKETYENVKDFEVKENRFFIFDTSKVEETGSDSDDSAYSWDTLADDKDGEIIGTEEIEVSPEEQQIKPEKVDILQDIKKDTEKDVHDEPGVIGKEGSHEIKSNITENYVEYCSNPVNNEPLHILESSKSHNTKPKEEASSLILDTLLKQCSSIFEDMRTKIMIQHQQQQDTHNEETETETKLHRECNTHDIDGEIDTDDDINFTKPNNGMSYNDEFRQLCQYFLDIYGKTLGLIYPVGRTSKLQYEKYITRRIIFEYMGKQQRNCGAVCGE